MPAEKKLTPMMQQWHEIRAKLADDTLLLFRLGDFYEIFQQDAERGAKLLGITLTHRHGMPMAGIPYHAADTYLQKLLDQGIKIAICDQTETPKPGKLVQRELTRIITPGTRLADTQIDANRNHFLLALDLDKKALHAAWLDLTTGEFVVSTEARPENLFAAFEGIDPREIIVPEGAAQSWAASSDSFAELYTHICDGRAVTPIPDYHFDAASGTPSRPRCRRSSGALRHRNPLRQTGQPPPASRIQHAKNTPARPGHLAQSGDFQVRRRHPAGLAA
jgi:DNA mismatch repair protein MutS